MSVKKSSLRNRSAFTLIEVIFVIVILGIVSMIGADIISHMYAGYLRSKVLGELTQKTELSIDQISKRLQYRIKDTAIARSKDNPDDIIQLSAKDINGSYTILEWIGYDNAGFLGEPNATATIKTIPGWSGFVDLENPDTNRTQIVTSGSHLSYAKDAINALSYGDINISNPSSKNEQPAIIFKCWHDLEPSKYGWDHTVTDHNNTLLVKSVGENILKFTEDTGAKELCEQYFLAWSAYALVPEGNNPNDFNLTLYYNFQPWAGERYTAGKSALLAEHVSTFRFVQVGNTVRVKLCIQDGNQTGRSIGICKEKAVF